MAAAPIGPLAWELPYATGVALKKRKNKNGRIQRSHCGSAVKNPTSIHEDVGSISGLAQRVVDPDTP